MKKKMTRGLSLLMTLALVLGMLLVNPFAMEANAATVTGYRYSGGGKNGSDVYFNDRDDNSTKLFTLNGSPSTKALCAQPDKSIRNGNYTANTTNVSGVVINALYDVTVNHSNSGQHIAAAQAVVWNVINGKNIDTQYTTGMWWWKETHDRDYKDEYEAYKNQSMSLDTLHANGYDIAYATGNNTQKLITLVPYNQVTVNNGTGDGGYVKDETVTITADAAGTGQRFDGWTVNNGGVTLADADATSTTFKMPANAVTVTASFVDEYTVTVNNGSGDGNYIEGETVTLSDEPAEGYEFASWTVNSGGVTFDTTNPDATFTMPANAVEITGNYDAIYYDITVNKGNSDVATGVIGDTVNVNADAPDEGYRFKVWTIDSGAVTFADVNSASTTITMPAENVEVTATYEAIPYAVTVNKGTGSADYTIGQNVSITADAPDTGYAFKEWVVNSGGVTLGDKDASSTGFTMPAGTVEVTATYDAIEYGVVVNEGTGDGDYTVEDTVNISARTPDDGYRFKEWTIVSGNVSFADANSADTSFDMIAGNVEVTATFELIPVNTVTVVNGDGDGDYRAGATVTIVADPPAYGERFLSWNVDGATLDSDTATATFTMPENAVTATATYEDIPVNSVTVINGTGGGRYRAGTPVTIVANDAPEGQRFVGWTVDGVSLSGNTASETFTMPENSVTATANFVPEYTLTVEGGTGGGKYIAGETAKVTATPADGYRFTSWTGAVADASAASTTFTMPAADTTITAETELIPLFTLTVEGGLGGGSYPEGAVVTVSATPAAGYRFTAWTGSVADASVATTTVTMPAEAVTVSAGSELIPTFTLTVTNGSGGGSYAADTVVPVTANAAPDGQRFAGWTGPVADATATSTTVTMPAAATTVEATYENIPVETPSPTVTPSTDPSTDPTGDPEEPTTDPTGDPEEPTTEPTVAPTPVPTPAPVVITPAPVALADPAEVLGATREGEVLGATRRVSTDDVNARWFVLFGLSAAVLTGVALTKKKDEEVESIK